MLLGRNTLILLTGILLAGWLCVPVWSQESSGLPLRHPDEAEDMRQCTDCHDPQADGFPFQRYIHGPLYGENHRMTATGHQRVCEMCHQPAFCSDCHGLGQPLKPSFKNHGDPLRRMPHRGNYLTRHRIDGHLNPAKCFRCHGRPKTAKTCIPCHG